MSQDVGAAIRKGAEKLAVLKTAFNSNDVVKSWDAVQDIMKVLIQFPTFLEPGIVTTTQAQEIILAREALELAVIVASRKKDLGAMECYFAQLNTYYTDISDVTVAASERKHLLIGLNLMRLLVCSGVSQFHCELETIPRSAYSNMFLKFPIQLERHLMEGSYHKLLHARGQVPSNDYLPLVEQLEETVRTEIARCIPLSYPTLKVESAQKMLMYKSKNEVLEMGRHCKWTLGADGETFSFSSAATVENKNELPAKQLLMDSIHYAAELQKVV